MYLINKYTKWYYSIISKSQKRVNYEGYTERHHIIPKSLGGTNEPSNLVKLTAKEHFICHLLLIKMTEGSNRTKMRYASWMMVKNNKNQDRTYITGRKFEQLKTQMKLANKERPGPNLGLVMPVETKNKLSKTLTGRKKPPQSKEHKLKISQSKKNPSEHTRLKISKARSAQKGLQRRSEETKIKMSKWQKGFSKPKKICEYCLKNISEQNYHRWHGGNCKLKT